MKKKKLPKKNTVRKNIKTSATPPDRMHPASTATRGLFTLLAALVMLLSLISFGMLGPSGNWLGMVGHALGWSAHALFGLTSYIACLFLAWIGWRRLFNKSINNFAKKSASAALLLASLALLLSLLEDRAPSAAGWLQQTFYPGLKRYNLHFHLGGAPLFYLYRDLPDYSFLHILNSTGTLLLSASGIFTATLMLAKVSPTVLLTALRELLPKRRTPDSDSEENDQDMPANSVVKPKLPTEKKSRDICPKDPIPSQPPYKAAYEELEQEELLDDFVSEEDMLPLPPSPAPQPAVGVSVKKQSIREIALDAQRVHNGDFAAYQLPGAALLTPPKKIDQSQIKKDLKRQAEILEQTLLNFGIEAKVGQINCGPTITSFEVHPAVGVKVQKIKALENDIALNLKAKSTRIIAPIPGKAAVGIEVPNAVPQEVGFKELLQAYQQRVDKFRIPMLLGKAVNGDYVMSDLTKMPHCIIAGATGSGKSVCINTIVMSIVLNAKPDEIKMVMIDPKKVELTPYTNLPHMLAPVITEPQGACAALNWLVKEMEKRYELLKLTGVRNIDSFNQRTIDQEKEASYPFDVPEKLPYIVVIIDELADLMMVSSSDIETPIARLAQMARAVGIHQILATQRPSREVITGLIKANFPARIAFKVASRVNSQIILDESGAESLLGNGDMLFLPPGTSNVMRAQGAYIRDSDINAIVENICQQAPPNYLIASFDTMKARGSGEDDDNGAGAGPGDPLYQEALEIVMSTGNASTTFLQRKLKIGYARAASLMDMLEKNGVVTPPDGSKARKVITRKPGKSGKKEDASPSSQQKRPPHDPEEDDNDF